MTPLSRDHGRIHFVGIGGIGMSGIAEVLYHLGYPISGSDQVMSPNLQRLRKTGIDVAIGHDSQHIIDAKAVVVSSAISTDNPEVKAASQSGIEVIQRADMLAELMRLKKGIAIGGSHGKTTTTSMAAAILDHAGWDPTVIIGGIVNALKSNARLGRGEWMVAEADESDGTFERIPAFITAITNIDDEHIDHYGDTQALFQAFQRFVDNTSDEGFCVVCTNSEKSRALVDQCDRERLILCGTDEDVDVRAVDSKTGDGRISFGIDIRKSHRKSWSKISSTPRFTVPMIGHHNMENALVAISIALGVDIPCAVIAEALFSFSGVRRRATLAGTTARGMRVIDDYAHHPTEIAAALQAQREDMTSGRLIAVFQPHRYSRVQSLFSRFCRCFEHADDVIVADIYAAGEKPLRGISRDALVAGIRDQGHESVFALPDHAHLAHLVADMASAENRVICLGAGDSTLWAYALAGEVDALDPKSVDESVAGGVS